VTGVQTCALPIYLEESLSTAGNAFERVRLLLGALPEGDQKELLEATRDALREAVQEHKAYYGMPVSGL